jgi:hypothetical protein
MFSRLMVCVRYMSHAGLASGTPLAHGDPPMQNRAPETAPAPPPGVLVLQRRRGLGVRVLHAVVGRPERTVRR